MTELRPKPFLRGRRAGDPCDFGDCEESGVLLRVNPVGEPGIFMCVRHAPVSIQARAQRRPFEKLMELVDQVEDRKVTLGQLSRQLGEPIERIMDAIDALKVLRGELTYIDFGGDHA